MLWLAHNQSSDGTCKVAAVNTQLAGCMQQTVLRYSLCSVNMSEPQTHSVTVSELSIHVQVCQQCIVRGWVRVRVGIREQRKNKRRSKALLSL